MAEQTNIDILINAKDNTKQAFNNLQNNLDANNAKLQKFGGQLDRAGKMAAVGLAAGLGYAAKEAMQFDKRMGDLSTLIAGDSTEAIKGFEDGIKSMMKEIPVDPDELGASAYSIVSAGITETNDALGVLKEASKLGVAGLATTEEATDLLTSAINAYGYEAKDANKVSNILFETVQAGKTTVAELSQSFGMVAPIANAAGVTFEELQAATAALTTSGLQTSVAQNQLKALFTELTREGTKVAQTLEDAGIQNAKLALETEGLDYVLNAMLDTVGNDEVAFKNLFTSVEGGGAALALVTEQSEAYRNTLGNLTDDVSSVDEGFEKQQETFEAQLKLMKNQFMPAFLDLGSALLEKITPAVKTLTDAISGNEELIARIVIPTLGLFVAAWGSVKIAMGVKTTVDGLTAAFRLMNTALVGQSGGAGLVKSIGSTSIALQAMGGATVLGAAAIATWQVVKAAQELDDELNNLTGTSDNLSTQIGILDEKIANAATDEERQKFEALRNELIMQQSAVDGLSARYDGFGGKLAAVGDKLGSMVGQAMSFVGLGPQLRLPGSNRGGIVTAQGIQHFQGGGVVKGIGNADTVPALLTPGEVILNPKRGQMMGEVNITFNNPQVRSENDLQSLIDVVQKSINRTLNLKSVGV